MLNKNTNIIISGGGTGGHLFPALAIAQALKTAEPEINILFVGAKGKIEEEKVPAAGYKIELLNITGFQRKFTFQNFLFFFRLIGSLIKSRRIIKKFKPDVVVGVGGYASGPLLRAAVAQKIPTLIQEQNSFPGITNRLLANKVDKICVAYDDLERFFPAERIIKTGNPVRENIVNNEITQEEAAKFFGLNPEKKIILSLGGSGGARTINESIIRNLKLIADSDVQMIWQTGKVYFEKSKSEADKILCERIRVFDFVSQMDYAFKAADIVISRAGAATISELCLVGKPAILVPSPNVAEDHQTKNADALVRNTAAIAVKDIEAVEKLIPTVLELISNSEHCKTLSENIKKMMLINSSKIIASEILKLKKVN
jgi:UDP-N-acetylglucosamine--N-acetylmuramyl-(pentapeptide) pyrophosphoryl-undecaprenol N-acetylglucosamine transferase